MREKKRWVAISLCFILISVILSGCGRSGASRFYTLSPVQPSGKTTVQSPSDRMSPVSIGIMPVEIPDYLDRPEIVTRNTPNGLSFSEYDRWGGDLRNDIARVLGETLSAQLPDDKVSILMGRYSTRADYPITAGDNIWLSAQWSMLAPSGQSMLLRRNTDLYEKMNGQGYPEMVAAMSRAVDRLGKEIAQTIKPVLAKCVKSNTGQDEIPRQ